MAFPNFKNKQANDSFFSPGDFLDYRRKRGKFDRFDPPEGVIICYDRNLIKSVTGKHAVTTVKNFSGDMHLFNEKENKVGIIGNFGFGAPVVVTVLEALVAFGVKRFISIGVAGTLQKNFKAGDLVVCDKAIRDEGTSYHYLESSKYSYASREMTDRIERALNRQGQKYSMGTSWTIDAPYRETVAEVKRYQEEGVATVEMEASALFAVAAYRNVDIGMILYAGDDVGGSTWKNRGWQKKPQLRRQLINLSIEACLGI